MRRNLIIKNCLVNQTRSAFNAMWSDADVLVFGLLDDLDMIFLDVIAKQASISKLLRAMTAVE